MSHHSMISGMSAGGISVPTSTKEKQRQIHLGTYSQILGKEVGGISKHEMHGVIIISRGCFYTRSRYPKLSFLQHIFEAILSLMGLAGYLCINCNPKHTPGSC